MYHINLEKYLFSTISAFVINFKFDNCRNLVYRSYVILEHDYNPLLELQPSDLIPAISRGAHGSVTKKIGPGKKSVQPDQF